MYFSTRKTCLATTRDAILRHYPAAGENPAYMRMMAYLLFSGRMTKDGKVTVLITEAILAEIESQQEALKSKNYVGRTFLESFAQECCADFTWKDWSKVDRVAREGFAEFPPELVDAIEADHRREPGDRLVYVETGVVYTKNRRSRDLKLLEHEAVVYVAQIDTPEAREIATYMNGVPVNVFSKFASRVGQVDSETLDPVQREALRRIDEQPKPFYRASVRGNSPRLYGNGLGFLTLKKEIRQVLMDGVVELDMTNFHLAYAAMDWEIPELLEFLATGKSFWEELLGHLGLPEIAKGALKEAIYGVKYGMSKTNLKQHLTSEFPDQPDVVEAFFREPRVAALLKARDKKLQAIRQAGGMTMLDGTWVKLSYLVVDGKRRDNAASLLARQAQGFELKALLPAVRLAQANPDKFRIVLWQHDGFSMVVRDRSRQACWVTRVTEAVNAELEALGIPSRLVQS